MWSQDGMNATSFRKWPNWSQNCVHAVLGPHFWPFLCHLGASFESGLLNVIAVLIIISEIEIFPASFKSSYMVVASIMELVITLLLNEAFIVIIWLEFVIILITCNQGRIQGGFRGQNPPSEKKFFILLGFFIEKVRKPFLGKDNSYNHKKKVLKSQFGAT